MRTLWGSNGKPMITYQNAGEINGPVVNLLWHDLEATVKDNKCANMPTRSAGWPYDKPKVRSTFLKNIKYIISNREKWRILVHVCALLP